MACRRARHFPLVFWDRPLYNSVTLCKSLTGAVPAYHRGMAPRLEEYFHMAKRRRRRSWSRTLLLIVFVSAAVYAGVHCLFRAPEVQAQDDLENTPAQEEQTDPEAAAAAAGETGGPALENAAAEDAAEAESAPAEETGTPAETESESVPEERAAAPEDKN